MPLIKNSNNYGCGPAPELLPGELDLALLYQVPGQLHEGCESLHAVLNHSTIQGEGV